ncbi:metallophosphoesterase [Cesiribacter sp. SM1]|uniref:metallophosphoesterase n=1 Tax=Cesiribacter sp. SM1 TaxID=2861196 RepID=UPI001CD4C1F7|nr:metallophosphoesterase [Cesiribacter sp. SM1]
MSRWLVTDIHGCYHSLKALLEQQLGLKKQDHLYLLGDYISKGPFSKQVLDYLMELREGGYQLHMLRGNHEQEVLNVLKGTTSLTTFREKGGFTFLNNLNISHPADIPDRYINFFEQLDWYFTLDDWILVHAGFDFEQEDPFQLSDKLVNIRDYRVNLSKTAGRKLLHGHSPTDLAVIEDSLEKKESLHISLDAGCVYKNNPAQACLIALNVDEWQWKVQKNIDEHDNYHL